jgi:hypothetical protein
MAELIPSNFPIPGEGAIASYNYTDIADGTGVTIFYLTQTKAGSLLTTAAIPSEAVYKRNSQSLNYDLAPFNSPRTIKGTAYVSIGIYQSTANGLTSWICQIKKESGGVVTTCSSAITGTLPSGNGGHLMAITHIPLTQTHFKKGDILRLNIEITNSNGDTDFGQDPLGRDGGQFSSAVTAPTITTVSKLYMPFKLDL